MTPEQEAQLRAVAAYPTHRRKWVGVEQAALQALLAAYDERKMHVYSLDNQVTHCGCRLCEDRQAVVATAQAFARTPLSEMAYDELLAAVAALTEES